MKIPQETIYGVLKHYSPGCRPLVSAELDYPLVSGKFVIQPTFYHIPRLEHATDIEIQLCLNQLAYAGVSEAIRLKLIPELNGLSFEEMRKERMLIIESRKRFRRPIKTDVEIRGELNVRDLRDFGNLILGEADFNFENKSCFGSLELVLIKNGRIK